MKKTTHIIKSNISSKWGKFVQQFRSYYPSVKDVDNIMLTEPIKIVIPYNLFPKNTKTKIRARIILHVNSKNQVDDSNFDLIASRCRLIVVPDTDVRSHVQKRNLGVPIYVIKLTDLELWGTVVSFNPSNPHVPQEIEIHPSKANYKKRVYIPEMARVNPCNWDEEIILLADRPDWAFGRIVERVYDKFNNNYKLKKKYSFTDKENKRGITFWWKQHNGFHHKNKSVVCLFDELSWQDSDVSFMANNYLAIAVSNRRIRKRVVNNKVVQEKNIPVYDIPDGVDTSFFSPAEKRPLKYKLQIGWCGNSKLNFFGFTDIKGFEILKQVAAATTDIADWHFVDRETNGIPFTSMPNFMRSLDIITCASIGEGTPNPILEGLSCGLLGLSTEVGLLPELQDDGCIVEIVDRTVESFVSAIKNINKNRDILAEARKKNPLIMKEKWDWSKTVNNYKNILDFLRQDIKIINKNTDYDSENICLLADTRKHVFHRITTRVEDAFKNSFKLKKCYSVDRMTHYKGVAFWWKDITKFLYPNLCAVMLYDDRLWKNSDIIEIVNNDVKCFGVANKKIYNKLIAIPSVINKDIPVLLVQDGVDTSFFSPAKLRPKKDKLQIGWAGIPRSPELDPKGYNILLRVAELTADIVDWTFAAQNTGNSWIPFDEMPNWYKSLDIIVCASLAEGTPNPILEGLSTGCMAISTDVGIVPELQDDGCIVEIVDRTVGAFVERIKYIDKHREILAEARENNPIIIKDKWDWNIKLGGWKKLLEIIADKK